jgi:hypothetical protein
MYRVAGKTHLAGQAARTRAQGEIEHQVHRYATLRHELVHGVAGDFPERAVQ